MKTKLILVIVGALVLVLLVAIVIFGGYLNSGPAPGGGNGGQGKSVDITNFAFSPSELKVKKGDTVTWTNKDSVPHSIVSDSGSELNSPNLSKEQTYSHTFNQTGIFGYHCSIHSSMAGKIVVE